VRKTPIGILFILPALVALALAATPASAQQLSMKQLEAQLRVAKQHRDVAVERARLAAMDLAEALALQAASGDSATIAAQSPLAALLLADGVVTDAEIAGLRKVTTTTGKRVTIWKTKVRALQTRIRRLEQIAEWNRRGRWWPLIKIAGDRYGVNPSGLHRMMMIESGGQRDAGSAFKGLFQYYPGTWRASWNPWRRQSIYDGWAQIQATAYAVHKGMGPAHWTTTYRAAF
jgi:soluble lytic murein transglycosylase-like protein